MNAEAGVPVGRLTDEQLRIILAIKEGRLSVNEHGRYVIDGEVRPDRKSREQLRSRGLIEHRYESGRDSYWRVTAKGERFFQRDVKGAYERSLAAKDLS